MTANPDQPQTEETHEDIKMYFTKEEWVELQDWEKEVYKNLKEHYGIITSFGYYISKPDFMCEIKETHQVSDFVPSHCSWDKSPRQSETNAVRKLVESPFPIVSNIHSIDDSTIMEKSGGEEQNENTYQHIVQELQERNTVQNKECRFYGCPECKEKFNCLETHQRNWEIHEEKRNECTNYKRERNHSNYTTPHRKEARCKEPEQQNWVESPMQSINQPRKAGKKQGCCTKDRQLGSKQPFELGPQKLKPSVREISSSPLHKCQQILTAEKTYKCTECGKHFTGVASLNKHQNTHTREKPYKCTECGKSYTQLGNLNVHKQIHTGERPYECTTCGKCFTQLENLNVHKRIHTRERPYKCTKCGKCFAASSALTRHNRVHTGEKPYKCTDCGKCFSNLGSLNIHKRLHTGEKPYNCTECGKSFTQLGNLNVHKQLHTGEKP
ncbi:zinc finger protein 726-like [Latimeria chalumnae]|uniref:zinc finger protein 726-like n=1 Tax=Latimeria chalumnae TaxID=7897 RepID=UPI00313DDF0F